MGSYLINEIILPSLIVFAFLYVLSFVIVMNIDDWFLIWFGLEFNIMRFLVLVYNRERLWNIESCLKYFFIQSLGSIILVGGYYLGEGYFEVVCSLILRYKIGGGPFFFWFPSVCSGISWIGCYMLMTLQKFLPLWLLIRIIGWWIWFIVVLSLIVGVWGCYNQMNLKSLLAFSSIHQIGWLLMCSYVGGLTWMIYYVVYFFVLLIIVIKLVKYEIVNLLRVVEVEGKLWMILIMINLGGVPPLLGFFMKWFGLYSFMALSYFFVIVMVLISVIMLYVYIRVCYNIFLGENIEIGWLYKESLFYNYNLMGVEVGILIGVFLGGFVFFFLF